MFFRDVVGQDKIKQYLLRNVKEERIAHAQMFYGNSGVGCLPMALAYAQYICCENRTEYDSCGKCPSCVKISKLSHPDLHFVFPSIVPRSDEDITCNEYFPKFREEVLKNPYFSLQDWQLALKETKKPIIHAKDASEIIRKLELKSFESKYKIMIIWSAEQMNDIVANKILKIVEEPQGETIFIFITDNVDKILPTIRSRVQHIFFSPIQEEALIEDMKRKGLYTSQTYFNIRLSKGSYNDLLKSIENNDRDEEYFQLFVNMMRTCWVFNENTFESEWEPLIVELSSLTRSAQIDFLQYMQRMMRENFIYRLNLPEIQYMRTEELNFTRNFSKFINENNIERIVSEISLAEEHINQNVYAKFVFTDMMFKIRELLKLK